MKLPDQPCVVLILSDNDHGSSDLQVFYQNFKDDTPEQESEWTVQCILDFLQKASPHSTMIPIEGRVN